jgi:diguanylate cyclase (GGDEF)-like protein/PAS domain S-box-containing protein
VTGIGVPNAHMGDVPTRLLDMVPDAIIVFDSGFQILYANRSARAFIGVDDVDDADAEPMNAASMVHPDDLAAIGDELADLLSEPGAVRTVRARIVNTEEVRPIEVFLVNLLDDPDVRGVVASFRDLRAEVALLRESEVKQRLLEHNDALREELLERQMFQARLLQIQQSISRRMPVNDVLIAVVQGAHDLLSDEIVELRLDPLDAFDHPTVVVSVDGPCWIVDQSTIDSDPGSLGELARLADRLVVAESGSSPLVAGHGARCGIAVPIRDRHRNIGSLAIATRANERDYRDVEREMLVNLAEHASVALMDARTVESVEAAFSDPLTGLPSRTLLMDRLAQSVDRCAREATPLAVMFIDLARFKGINDSYGHAVGDEILAAIGRRVASVLRSTDTGARLGGDEFVVVLENTDAVAAFEVASRLLVAVREPIHVGSRVLYADATVGIAVSVDGSHVDDGELLLRRADIAMYEGKTSAREIVFFEASMQAELLDRQELESEIRGAVTNRKLHVAFQPMIHLRTGELIGVEALARWHHPTRGFVPPSDFVTTAERIGAIVELDRLVWAQACKQVSALPANRAGNPLSISLNLSAKHLSADDLVVVLSQILAEFSLSADRVTVEITETELMRDVVAAAEQLWALRRLGVHIAIDDFGTGYSSLAYLQTLPIEILKIDRAFVSGIGTSLPARQLVQAMVNLSHGLGMSVVAEGIEQQIEADVLRHMNADIGQGFFFSHPIDVAALRGLLTADVPA